MTEEKQSWSLDTAFDEHASKEAQAEATAFRTVPGGTYRFVPEKAEPLIAGEKSPWPGARTLHVTYAAERTQAFEDRVPKSKFFVDYLIDEKRNADGKLDKAYSLMLQAQKALGKSDASLGDTVEAIGLYPLNAYVTEVAVFEGQGDGVRSDGSLKDRYETVKADGSRKDAMTKASAAGAKFKNFVQNVSVAK